MSHNPYEVLGVSPSATDDQIKAAYRKLAKQYHPDLNGGSIAAEAKMKEINQAYTFLIKNKGKAQDGGRGQYGQTHEQQWGQSAWGGAYQSSGSGYGNTGRNPFEDFFGNGRQKSYEHTAYTEFDPQLKRVEDAFLDRDYARAKQYLSNMKQHRAAWYFRSAKVDQALGNRVSALNHARIAVQMEPDQPAFRELYADLTSSGQSYWSRSTQQGFGGTVCSNPCMACLIANVLFNCCFGRGFCC